MAKVVFLEDIKDLKAARRGFKEWRRLFKSSPPLNEQTRWRDLPDEVISHLAEDDQRSRLLFQDLLMGTLDLGSGWEFQDLPSRELSPLLDIYFLLIDQVRFECMRRLGWIEEIPLAEEPIISLIRRIRREGSPFLLEVPRVSQGHPDYPAYLALTPAEKQAFIRRSIPKAVAAFKEKIRVHV